MLKKLTSIALMSMVLIACKGKPPYVPDYENAVGLIIGPETCRVNAAQNAWLIQFSGPNAGNKSYGETITYSGNTYSNVVKTYLLPDSSKVSGRKYLFEFYLEGKSAQNDCDLANPITFNISKIRLKNIVKIAN
ncbi:hypothetical protein EZ456_04495 [Pedobacter psychrodurus]|uniref:Lipoprotein n=1 Tax=Pedobacter psychrodurus TaxID=2530456 RepID=A0A4R0PZG7_9SPHI|nr:hypothetical protein [Pedobacter psychrodurus]TCD28652.1 hypothetical protein EZ456_04495 [Pedobacter psychrodurus]